LVKADTQATLAAVTELANGWLPPQNFSALSATDVITLSWDATPETSKYKVYKNDVFLAETATTSYVDYNVVLGEKYAYFVKGIRLGSNEESNSSNVDSLIFSAPLPIPYSLDLNGDKEELKYWWFKNWVVRTQNGLSYFTTEQLRFSIMELDWFPVPENVSNISLHLVARDASSGANYPGYWFIEVTSDRKTWHKLAKSIDFKKNMPDTLTLSLNEFIGSSFLQLRIRTGTDRQYDFGRIHLHSLVINHSPVSITENEKATYFKNLLIFPNPTTGIVTIKTESENSYALMVYDAFGKRLLQKNVFQDGTLDLSTLSKGTYFIQVLQNNHQVAKKVVIQ
jgi:hypothetical protein